MTVWEKFLTYIGLGPEHNYNDSGYDTGSYAAVDNQPMAEAHMGQGYNTQAMNTPISERAPISAQPINNQPTYSTHNIAGSVQPLLEPSRTEPKMITPTTFEACQVIANHFKANSPVIINLERTEVKLTRRVIDFASGVCYSLGGKMKPIGSRIYLMTPKNAYFTDEDLRIYLEEARNADYN